MTTFLIRLIGDVLITSFDDAVPMLEAATGRKWHSVSQGVLPKHFLPPEPSARQIGFCSYGRRDSKLHAAISRFAAEASFFRHSRGHRDQLSGR